jgi:serine/threonine-protein kinase
VLYEMLAGELPFGSDRMSSISRKLTQAAPSIRALRESVPDAVDQITRRCLARVPADRYRTAEELCAALGAGAS